METIKEEKLRELLTQQVGDSLYLKFPNAFKKRYDMKNIEPEEVKLTITDKTTELTFVFLNETLKEKK